MNYDDFEKEQEPTMSIEEEKAHKSHFSRVFFALLAFVAVWQCGTTLAYIGLESIAPSLASSTSVALILNAIIQYLVACPVLWLIIKKLDKSTLSARNISGKEFFKYLSISSFLVYMGSYVSLIIEESLKANFGIVPESSVASVLEGSSLIVSLICAGILAPIVEELIFRKLLIDRLVKYGEKTAIFLSAFVFGLIHLGIEQIFYAFLVGIVLSFVYVKTGKIIYSIAIHMFINLFYGIFSSYINQIVDLEGLMEYFSQEITDVTEQMNFINQYSSELALLGIYSIVFYILFFAGIFNFNKNLYRLNFQKGSVIFPRGKALDIVFMNGGAILFMTACLALMAFYTFAA